MRTRFTILTSILITLLGLIPLNHAFAQLRAQPLDNIMVVVDDDVILQSEFDARYSQIKEQLAAGNMPNIPEEELRKQVLDQLILEELQLQVAFRGGVRVDDNMLNQAMTGIAQQNNMSFEQFRQVLDNEGVYQQTREQVRRDIIINELQNRAVNSRIEITRQEIANYLRSESGLSDIAPEYRVAHILIPRGDSALPGRQEELAQALFQRVVAGEDILTLAGSRQISGMQVSGGDLGWKKVEGLPSLFQPVVPGLESGETAEPFSSSSGYHIVKLLDTRGGATLKMEQTKLRHILISPNEIRTEEQAEELVKELYERIQNGEDFADLARQNTDDPTSMVSGGDLDWVNRGQLPDDFWDVVEATEVGEMPPPFRVSTGWHIIEIQDRRLADMTEENKRFQAEQLLRQRKFENELQNWLTELRDTAYIDYKDE